MARLQLDLTDTSDKLVERIMELCDLKTKKDVVENALILLAWAASNTKDGRTIAAIDESRGVYKEISTPALEGAALFEDRKEGEKIAAERRRGVQNLAPI